MSGQVASHTRCHTLLYVCDAERGVIMFPRLSLSSSILFLPCVLSCVLVSWFFTVYGICTTQGLYVLPRAEPEEVHTAQGRYYPMHCKNHETAHLYT